MAESRVHKTASISIRLTADEQRQLQADARDAGLSLSDYLRSRIFTAESVRSRLVQITDN